MQNTGRATAEKSFIVEALIISLSNFVVKIIGVLFKIPMTYILGVNMGIFNAAYSIYAMLFMLSTAGLPVAISRLVASANERGRPREIRRVYRLSVTMFGLIGLFCSLLLFFGAEAIGNFSEHRDAALAMRVISPTLFLICISSAIRGYFQGLKNMYPTAISQFIEAFFKLAVGLGAVAVSKNLGASPAVQAAFGISGLTVGVFLGTAAAFSKQKWVSGAVAFLSTIGVSVPSFLLALLMMLVFGVLLGWLPIVGLSSWQHYIMPSIALALSPIAMITRLVRTSLMEVMRQDYMVLARSKGTSELKVIIRHALKNALVPVITYAGPLIATLLTGSFVVETLFSVPGIGAEFVNSVSNRDYTLIMALTIFYGSFIIIANIVTDLITAAMDPRIRLK